MVGRDRSAYIRPYLSIEQRHCLFCDYAFSTPQYVCVPAEVVSHYHIYTTCSGEVLTGVVLSESLRARGFSALGVAAIRVREWPLSHKSSREDSESCDSSTDSAAQAAVTAVASQPPASSRSHWGAVDAGGFQILLSGCVQITDHESSCSFERASA